MILLKGGQWTSDPRLDRVKQFDVKSRGYRIREYLDENVPVRSPRSRGWSPGPGLDQGWEGACVGFGGTHRRQGLPVRVPGLTTADARGLYHLAQQLDEWEGGSYPGASPVYEGTSILAGMKAGQKLGWWGEYRWIGAGSQTPIEDVVDTLGYVGGIIFGLDWLEGMMSPRPSGLLEVQGSVVGGHAVYACAVWLRGRLKGEGTKPMELVVFQQSWGPEHGAPGYGQPGGFVFIKLVDLEMLLGRQGEGAVPLELRPPPLKPAA